MADDQSASQVAVYDTPPASQACRKVEAGYDRSPSFLIDQEAVHLFHSIDSLNAFGMWYIYEYNLSALIDTENAFVVKKQSIWNGEKGNHMLQIRW